MALKKTKPHASLDFSKSTNEKQVSNLEWPNPILFFFQIFREMMYKLTVKINTYPPILELQEIQSGKSKNCWKSIVWVVKEGMNNHFLGIKDFSRSFKTSVG